MAVSLKGRIGSFRNAYDSCFRLGRRVFRVCATRSEKSAPRQRQRGAGSAALQRKNAAGVCRLGAALRDLSSAASSGRPAPGGFQSAQRGSRASAERRAGRCAPRGAARYRGEEARPLSLMEDRWLRGVWRWAADRLRVRVGWNTAGRSNADARADLGLGVARGLKLAEQALDVVGGYPGVNRGRRELASDGVGAQIPGIDVIK